MFYETLDEVDPWPAAGPTGASGSVYRGIMQDLEERRMVPGQKLVETELAARFGVGRNAVREAMQRLAMRGVIDLNRNRSASIRLLNRAETMEVLDVAAVLTALAAGAAAARYKQQDHARILDAAMDNLAEIGPMSEIHLFSRARRNFYRALLVIGGNRELQRVFPAVGMHLIFSQFESPRLRDVRLGDYRAMRDAIVLGQAESARLLGSEHVDRVRTIICDLIGP